MASGKFPLTLPFDRTPPRTWDELRERYPKVDAQKLYLDIPRRGKTKVGNHERYNTLMSMYHERGPKLYIEVKPKGEPVHVAV